VIDRSRCMAKKDGTPLFGGERCQAPATHASVLGRLCAKHAEELKALIRSADTFANVILGRARTEEEISRLVVELNS